MLVACIRGADSADKSGRQSADALGPISTNGVGSCAGAAWIEIDRVLAFGRAVSATSVIARSGVLFEPIAKPKSAR